MAGWGCVVQAPTMMRQGHGETKQSQYFRNAGWPRSSHTRHSLQYLMKSWCFSDCASCIDYILITNLMQWLLFIHKILYSSTCFEPYVLIFRRIQVYTRSIWYCHSLREFVLACRYTAWVRTQAVYWQATTNSRRQWQYHMLHVYNCILLKMST